jgi:hypothetical protein
MTFQGATKSWRDSGTNRCPDKKAVEFLQGGEDPQEGDGPMVGEALWWERVVIIER